jgi:hypothetical protein
MVLLCVVMSGSCADVDGVSGRSEAVRSIAPPRNDGLRHRPFASVRRSVHPPVGVPPVSSAAADLLAGTWTDVPRDANAAFLSVLDKQRLHVFSAVTGVEFHVPGVISSAPGGLSPAPIPLLMTENGVAFWQISGELSGLFTDAYGFAYVVGPIDETGVNHRAETFAPNSGAHPRAGLPGAFFALKIPVAGWNGGLIQMQAPADGGTRWPAAALIWPTVDTTVLLDRGYAVFTFGAGGSVPYATVPGGPQAVDTNPESGSGIFWASPPYDPVADDADRRFLVSNIRPALMDGPTGVETAFPEPTFVSFQDPFEGTVGGDIGFPDLFYSFDFESLQWYPELVTDSAIFAKNLLRAFTGKSTAFTCWIGWSGSGRNPPLIDSGTRGGTAQNVSSAGPEIGGGDYNVWGQPASGLRYDGFISYAGPQDSQLYQDGSFDILVDPKHPIAAPLVWIVPEVDIVIPQSHAYIYANAVARALQAQGRGDAINDYLRIYVPRKLTHLERDQLYANLDRTASGDALWYDYQPLVSPNPGAFNTARRGLRVSAGYERALPWNGPLDGWDDFFHGEARMPRTTPFFLQILADLREHQERGTPLPVSRMHANFFADLAALDTTLVPPYPAVDCPNDTFADVIACAQALTTDSIIHDDPSGIPRTLDPHEVDVLRWFAANNPLARSLEPLAVPDIAAPLGTEFLFYTLFVERPFSDTEIAARYGSRRGWLAAFRDASDALVRARLWDPALGATYVRQAESDIAH